MTLTMDRPAPYSFTKAQMALLLEAALPDTFSLDTQGITDLELDEPALRQAEQALVARQVVDAQHLAVAEPVAALLARVVEPGWKVIVQIQSRTPQWRQLALHIGTRPFIGEGLALDEGRLMQPLLDEQDAAAWLVEMTALGADAAEPPPERRPLEQLVPRAQQVAIALIANSATDEASEAMLWLVADRRLWYGDRSSAQTMRSVSTKALADRLHRRMQALTVVPTD